ncbi:MAG: AMP-binding protein [Pseudohongiellaceae bacterium]
MLQHHFIDSARKHPKKLAFIDGTTKREVSYERALIGSLILARRFRKLERGRIGILLPTSAGAGLAIIGTAMAGLTPVMINYSTGAKENCVFAHQQCDFRIIITSRLLLEKVNCKELPGMVFLEDIMDELGRYEKVLALLKSRLPGAWLKRLCGRLDLDKPAVILFTSGSEREPKIVQLTQRNLLANIHSFTEMMDLQEMDSLLAVLPYFHVMGFTVALWTPLYLGITSVNYSNPLEFKTVAKLIEQHQPHIIIGTPLFLEGYARQSQAGDFAGVKLAVCGADKCPEALRELYRSKHQLEIHEGYGTTETSPVISANPQHRNRPGSIGLPIPGVEVKIVNYDTGEPCRIGETGKITVCGENVMQGYLNDVEETSMRLKSGWYDTGDLGYLDEDGYLWHQGRLRRFVKIGGEMISLVRVEDALNEVTPEEVECGAIELPDSKRGSRIVAVTSLEVDGQEVNKKLADLLPNLALPKKYVIVAEFPRMGSGKTDFRTLTAIVREMEEEEAEGE